MAKITDIPATVSNAGLNAPYPGTESLATVTVVSCPLDPGYEWVATSQTQVDAHIDAEVSAGRCWQSHDVHAFKHEGLHLPIPFHMAGRFNYMRVTQGGFTRYYFASPEPVTAASTMWTLTSDVWTTYMPTVRGTLLRGHLGIKMALSDTSILNEPEPIDVGELVTVAEGSYDIFGSGYDIMAISATNIDGPGFRDVHSELEGQDTPINMTAETAGLAQNGDTFSAVTTTASGYLPPGGWPIGNIFENGANYLIGFPLTPDPVDIPWEGRVPRSSANSTGRFEYRPMPGDVHVLTRLGWQSRVNSYSHAPWMWDGLVGTNAVPIGAFPAVSGGGSARQNFEYNPDNSADYRFPSAGSRLPASVSYPDRGATYARTGSQTLISNWRGFLDDGSAIGQKLTTRQFAAVAFGDLSGQERIYSPDAITSSSLTVSWRRTFGIRSEYAFWPTGVTGEEARPFTISWSVGFGVVREGFAQAFGPQAVAYHTDRKLAEAKYISDIRQQAYARYASQAQEGAFNTVMSRMLGGWGGFI